MSKIAKSIKTESRVEVLSQEEFGVVANGYRVSFQVDEDVIFTGFCKFTLKTIELYAFTG